MGLVVGAVGFCKGIAGVVGAGAITFAGGVPGANKGAGVGAAGLLTGTAALFVGADGAGVCA